MKHDSVSRVGEHGQCNWWPCFLNSLELITTLWKPHLAICPNSWRSPITITLISSLQTWPSQGKAGISYSLLGPVVYYFSIITYIFFHYKNVRHWGGEGWEDFCASNRASQKAKKIPQNTQDNIVIRNISNVPQMESILIVKPSGCCFVCSLLRVNKQNCLG